MLRDHKVNKSGKSSRDASETVPLLANSTEVELVTDHSAETKKTNDGAQDEKLNSIIHGLAVEIEFLFNAIPDFTQKLQELHQKQKMLEVEPINIYKTWLTLGNGPKEQEKEIFSLYCQLTSMEESLKILKIEQAEKSQEYKDALNIASTALQNQNEKNFLLNEKLKHQQNEFLQTTTEIEMERSARLFLAQENQVLEEMIYDLKVKLMKEECTSKQLQKELSQRDLTNDTLQFEHNVRVQNLSKNLDYQISLVSKLTAENKKLSEQLSEAREHEEYKLAVVNLMRNNPTEHDPSIDDAMPQDAVDIFIADETEVRAEESVSSTTPHNPEEASMSSALHHQAVTHNVNNMKFKFPLFQPMKINLPPVTSSSVVSDSSKRMLNTHSTTQ